MKKILFILCSILFLGCSYFQEKEINTKEITLEKNILSELEKKEFLNLDFFNGKVYRWEKEKIVVRYLADIHNRDFDEIKQRLLKEVILELNNEFKEYKKTLSLFVYDKENDLRPDKERDEILIKISDTFTQIVKNTSKVEEEKQENFELEKKERKIRVKEPYYVDERLRREACIRDNLFYDGMVSLKNIKVEDSFSIDSIETSILTMEKVLENKVEIINDKLNYFEIYVGIPFKGNSYYDLDKELMAKKLIKRKLLEAMGIPISRDNDSIRNLRNLEKKDINLSDLDKKMINFIYNKNFESGTSQLLISKALGIKK